MVCAARSVPGLLQGHRAAIGACAEKTTEKTVQVPAASRHPCVCCGLALLSVVCSLWQAAARRFRQLYISKYGTGGPDFAENPLMETLEMAALEHKMVLVYLHSELNQDTDAFCGCVTERRLQGC